MERRVVILGGTGKMGRWFARFLKQKDFDVAIHSRSPERAAKTAEDLQVNYIKSIDDIRDADIVLVSTSLSSTAETIRTVSKRMKPHAVLFDIASVKRDVIEALEEASALGIRAISVHPMFGPGATSLKGKKVIVIPIGDDHDLVDEVLGLFKGADIQILSSGKAHDMMVAMTLSLPHFINLVFGKTLASVNLKEVAQFAGTTFALQLLVTEAVYSEDPDLYYEIQSQNPAFVKVLDAFLDSVRETTSAIKRKDRKAFLRSFKEAQAFLAKDQNFADAYSRFYKAYEAVLSTCSN